MFNSAYPDHLLRTPANAQEYDEKVEALDRLLDVAGDDENHPFSSLIDRLSDVIEEYDEAHTPKLKATGADVLRMLMEVNKIQQSELPEVGPQPTVSAILAGKRKLNLRQVQALSKRFNVTADTFME